MTDMPGYVYATLFLTGLFILCGVCALIDLCIELVKAVHEKLHARMKQR
jgi:hypothetical protein